MAKSTTIKPLIVYVVKAKRGALRVRLTRQTRVRALGLQLTLMSHGFTGVVMLRQASI